MRLILALCGLAIIGGLVWQDILPVAGVDWIYLLAFAVGGAAALWQGRNMANVLLLVAAATLIQSLINILGLSPLTKIVNGALFMLALWKFSDGLDLWVKKKNEDAGFVTSGAAPQGASMASGKTAQAVFEEFQAFTGSQGSADRGAPDPDEDAAKPPRKGNRHKGRRRHGKATRDREKRPSRDKAVAPRDKTGTDDARSTQRPSRGPARNKPDHSKVAAALQAQQHAVQLERQRLEEERAMAERKRKAEEARLRQERAALEKEKAALQARPPARQTAPDHRTPEEILGLNNPGFTLQDLKEARKREVARWHTSSMGNKPKELVDLAEEELKKINLAFDTLKKRFT